MNPTTSVVHRGGDSADPDPDPFLHIRSAGERILLHRKGRLHLLHVPRRRSLFVCRSLPILAADVLGTSNILFYVLREPMNTTNNTNNTDNTNTNNNNNISSTNPIAMANASANIKVNSNHPNHPNPHNPKVHIVRLDMYTRDVKLEWLEARSLTPGDVHVLCPSDTTLVVVHGRRIEVWVGNVATLNPTDPALLKLTVDLDRGLVHRNLLAVSESSIDPPHSSQHQHQPSSQFQPPYRLLTIAFLHSDTVVSCRRFRFRSDTPAATQPDMSTTRIDAGADGVAAIAVSPSGDRVAVASTNGCIVRVYSLDRLVWVDEFTRGASPAVIHAMVFAPDGRWLLVYSSRGTVHLFALSSTSTGTLGDGEGSGGSGGSSSSSSSGTVGDSSSNGSSGLSLASSNPTTNPTISAGSGAAGTGWLLDRLYSYMPRYITGHYAERPFRYPDAELAASGMVRIAFKGPSSRSQSQSQLQAQLHSQSQPMEVLVFVAIGANGTVFEYEVDVKGKRIQRTLMQSVDEWRTK